MGTASARANTGPSGGRVLVVANAYPSQDELYRYAFVHTRVKEYLLAGLDVDVYSVDTRRSDSTEYTFDGVRVFSGPPDHYSDWIAANRVYSRYLVHFPVAYLIEPLRLVDAPCLFWLHGYEVEGWHRRWFNLLRDDAVRSQDVAKRCADPLHNVEGFRNFISERPETRCITVSNWFRNRVAIPDLHVPNLNPLVIPNFIDGERFRYVEKDPEMARRVLVVRPFTNWKYSTDQIVDVILRVSRESTSRDGFTFTLFGDGPLFDAVTAPLRSVPGVFLHKTFLTQAEIAQQHREHGVFLAPTRWDSQGVSTCEAMASGLVPVSTDSSAVPEFIQHEVSGLLSPLDDTGHMAESLFRLANDSGLFTRLSRGAASTVRKQCSRERTIDREVTLIQGEMRSEPIAPPTDWEANYRELESQFRMALLEAKRLLENAHEASGSQVGL